MPAPKDPAHYLRWRRQLSESRQRSIAEKFWPHVQKTEKCWIWTGGKDTDGYGRSWHGSRALKAHRASWILHYGDLPDGMLVCHHCDNRGCVRPDHLFIGTSGDNTHDAVSKGRMCHPHTAESKAKISAAHKGRQRRPEELVRLASLFKGHKHSEEARRKISEAGRGRPVTPETIAKRVATRRLRAIERPI